MLLRIGIRKLNCQKLILLIIKLNFSAVCHFHWSLAFRFNLGVKCPRKLIDQRQTLTSGHCRIHQTQSHSLKPHWVPTSQKVASGDSESACAASRLAPGVPQPCRYARYGPDQCVSHRGPRRSGFALNQTSGRAANNCASHSQS